MEKFMCFARAVALAVAFVLMTSVNFITTVGAQALPVVSQEAACGPWNQPLNIAIPARQRVSIGRIVEMLAEDCTNAQAALAQAPAQLPFPRLATRDRTSSGVSTVEALVNAVYAGNNEAVKAALIREVTSMIRRLGPNRLSLEETWLWCPVVDASGAPILDAVTGRPRHISPTSGVCADGSIPRTGSRSRMLTNSFAGDFYADSMVPWTNGRAPVDYHGWRGHSLRVTIKNGSAFSIPRVYTADNHPRPGAQLCRRIPQLVDEAATATSSTAKQAVLDEQARLTTAAIAEGDLPTAMWATMFAASAVNPAVANLAVTRDCEARESVLQGQLATANRRIDALTGQLKAALARGNSWRTNANVGYGFLMVATALFIIFVLRTRSAMDKSTQSWQKRVSAAATDAKNQFWNGLEFELSQMVSAVHGFLPAGESLTWARSFDGVPSIARVTADDPNGFFHNLRTAFATALNARKASSTPPALPPSGTQPAAGSNPPPSTTPISYVDNDGLGMEINAQTDFDAAAKAIAAAAFQRGVESVATVNAALCAPYTGVTHAASPTAPSVFTLSALPLEPSEVEFTLTTVHIEPALADYYRRAVLAHRVENVVMARIRREYIEALDFSFDRGYERGYRVGFDSRFEECANLRDNLTAERNARQKAEGELKLAQIDHSTMREEVASAEAAVRRTDPAGALGHRTNILTKLAQAGIIHRSLAVAPFDTVKDSIEDDIAEAGRRLTAEAIMRPLLSDMLGVSRLHGVLNGEKGVIEELRLGVLILATGEVCLFGVFDPAWITEFWKRWNAKSADEKLPAARPAQAMTGRMALVTTGDLPATPATSVRDLDFTGSCEVATIRDFTGPISINPEQLVTTAEHDAICLDAHRREINSLTAQRKVPTRLLVKAHGRTRTRASSIPPGFVFDGGLLIPAHLSQSAILAPPGDAE